MNKIKRELVSRIIDEPITSKEFDMLILITSIQEEDGTVPNIYYKDIANSINCVTATFYDVIDSLERKKFILKSEKSSHRDDIEIKVIGNDFSNDWIAVENDEEGNITKRVKKYKDYIETDYAFLYEDSFKELPVGAKKLALYYLNRYNNKKKHERYIFAEKHYLNEEFCGRFHVQSRSIKKYYDLLSDYISYGTELVQDFFGNGNVHRKYDVVTLKKAFTTKITRVFTDKNKPNARSIPANFLANEHKIKTLCRKKKISFDLQTLTDTTGLFHQYSRIFEKRKEDILCCENIPEDKKLSKTLWDFISTSILQCADITLNPINIHAILKEKIAMLSISAYLQFIGA